MNALLLALVLVLTGWPASLQAQPTGSSAPGTLPAYQPKDPTASEVTAKNLLASDRFWPYQVAVTHAVSASENSKALESGAVGVLIRVEADDTARIDFGRDGMHRIPVAKTDLVERANRVRRGELEKVAPNFVLAIGPRLVDAASATMQPLPFPDVAAGLGMLSVFADPNAKDFSALAMSLAPLSERVGVFTILFPQGQHPDAGVRDQLRALKWPVPFVYDHLAEAYTKSLIDPGAALPVVLLQTRDGRVLYQSSGKAIDVAELGAAIDRSLPPAAAADAAKAKQP
jgi:hypothetical protein